VEKVKHEPVKFNFGWFAHKWDRADRVCLLGFNETNQEYFTLDGRQLNYFINDSLSKKWLPVHCPKRRFDIFLENRFGRSVVLASESQYLWTMILNERARTYQHVVLSSIPIPESDEFDWIQQLGYRSINLKTLHPQGVEAVLARAIRAWQADYPRRNVA